MGLGPSTQGREEGGQLHYPREAQQIQGREEGGQLQNPREAQETQVALTREQQQQEEAGSEEDEEQNGLQAPAIAKASPVTASRHPEGDRRRFWDPHGGTLVRVPDLGAQRSRRSGLARRQMEDLQEDGEEVCTSVYLIRCAESTIAEDVVRGRCPAAVLTPHGFRQARALGLSFLARGLRFDALLSSPIDRCKQTALSVCQEMNFNQSRVEFGEALMEVSNGLWEGLRKLDVYSGDIVDAMANLNQDFHAPGGESQRQVEFRAVEFLNSIILTKSLHQIHHQDERFYYADPEVGDPSTERYMPPYSNAPARGKSKSGMQIKYASTQRIGSLDDAGQHSPYLRQWLPSSTYCIAVFSHELTIKCILRGLMAFPPSAVEQVCIDPTSVTVLRHSTIFGWKIMQVNDTSHLRTM